MDDTPSSYAHGAAMNMSKLQEDRGIRLPERYIELVRSVDPNDEYCFEGRYWRFFDEAKLAENVAMSGVGNAPYHHVLKLYIDIYKQFRETDLVCSDSDPLPADRVANGFVVAQENTDLLYLDPQDGNSVWIYYPDGSDVEKVSNSIDEWLDKATTDTQ